MKMYTVAFASQSEDRCLIFMQLLRSMTSRTNYTDKCGGNGELTIEHFAAPPPPLPREESSRRRTLTCTERNIYSVPFATVIPTDTTPMVGGRKCKVRMLCC